MSKPHCCNDGNDVDDIAMYEYFTTFSRYMYFIALNLLIAFISLKSDHKKRTFYVPRKNKNVFLEDEKKNNKRSCVKKLNELEI